MNVDWMRCFIEVVKRGSISKASEVLKLTQPAVSQQIKKMEEFFGVHLFHRSAFGMELTEAGQTVYSKMQSILRDIDDLSLDILKYKKLKKVIIGTIPSLAMYYLPPRMLKMQAEGIEVEVQVRNTSKEVFQLLASEEIHLALIEHKENPTGYWSREILEENYFAVVPNKHPLSDRTDLSIRELEDESLIVYPSTCDIRCAILEEYRKNDLEPNISIEVAFGESIFGFVLEEIGIAIVPEIVTRHTNHLPLSVLPIQDFQTKRVISAVTRSKSVGELLATYLLL